jgi:beta-mannosidase
MELKNWLFTGGAIAELPVELPTTFSAMVQQYGVTATQGLFSTDVECLPGKYLLSFEGLSVPCQVMLNDVEVLFIRSAFQHHTITVDLLPSNKLTLVFGDLDAYAKLEKLPRARWRQQLVTDNRLRGVRNSLLGNMPGWCPERRLTGPFRPVMLEPVPTRQYDNLLIEQKFTDSVGLEVNVIVRFDPTQHDRPTVAVRLNGVDMGYGLVSHTKLDSVASFLADVSDLALWWPHTNGTPDRQLLQVFVNGDLAATQQVCTRTVHIDSDANLFINGRRIFCRGVIWTPPSLTELPRTESDFRPILQRLVEAGVNMIRVPGNGMYEARAFYDLCDELGIMVWQDLMFSNFDYPRTEAFVSLVLDETSDFLQRTKHNGCIVVLCGGSEVLQQAAMLGIPASRYQHELFEDYLPELVATERGGSSVYWPNSPYGGEWPFQTDTGITHYFGVPAYLREFSDIRRANVKFASECLALANVPCAETVSNMGFPAVHDPRWKQGVPRDNNASWDFEDVRDTYLERLFSVNASFLRRTDQNRYLELSRATSCLLVKEVFSEWRSSHSKCGGGLVLNLHDMQDGAGWGLIDSRGLPKPAFFALQSVSQRLQIVLTDEGLNGLDIHVINETDRVFQGKLQIECFRQDGEILPMDGAMPVDLMAQSNVTFSSRAIFKGFFDICYAYKFGPLAHLVTYVSLVDVESGALLAEATHYPAGPSLPILDLGLRATLSYESRHWHVLLETDRFAQFVHFDVRNFTPDADWFDVTPGRKRKVRLKSCGNVAVKPEGHVLALNGRKSTSMSVI